MNDATITDEDLAVRARRDQDAFIVLYRRYVKRVYGYHLVRTNNDQDAQDLTSETFLAALASLENYRPSYSFGAWLMGIAYHKLMDHFRRQSPVIPLVKVPDPPAPDPTPEKQLSQQSNIKAIHRALDQLTEDRAGAISLRYFGGLNVAETARVMDKSRGAVKMLVMRGLRELRDHLDVL